MKMIWIILLLSASGVLSFAQKNKNKFRVIAFFTAQHDLAHISFVHEAIPWFEAMSHKHHFIFDTTSNWENMDDAFLNRYQVVIFLDTRPEQAAPRSAFQKYMDHGGAWMGFHFAGFALTPSAYNQDWDWYHEKFLGSGQYKSNTWRPTSAYLRNEKNHLPFTRHFKKIIHTAPCEWYRWQNDLRKNQDIEILLTIHPKSFPLGTGPKPKEIWHEGDYPIAWTNTKYKMIYFNFGHNDMDYEGVTHKALSSTFSSAAQNRYLLKSILWLGKERSN